jgi:hypothetical protein
LQNGLEYRERRTKPPNGHPRLVQGFRIAIELGGENGYQLIWSGPIGTEIRDRPPIGKAVEGIEPASGFSGAIPNRKCLFR